MEDDDVPDTRVFVSGLPPNFTSNQLGAHFAGRYQITDATVIPDRRIGFVGFRNYTLAKSAINYFDKTYIRMSKISVQMAKPVEIERTSTPYGVPKTKQSKQGTVHRPSLLDSGATNGHTTSSTKPITDSAFQPYVPVLKSNKRKREPPGDLQDEFSKPTDTTIAAVAASGQRQYPRPVAEQEEDRDLKKARRREKKERKEREAGVGKANGVESHEKDKSTPLETKRKRKKEKTDDPKSHDVDVDALTSSKSTEGLDISQREGKQEKKKKREGKDVVSITELNEQSQQAEMDGVTEHGVGKKKSQSREMADGGIKGGVESIDDDASEHSKLSADQDKQPPPKFNVTSDNDWLRAKTSRVLDLMDESLPNSASVFPETQEQSDETPTAQEVENVERPATSAEGPNIGLVPTSLPSIGRLFVRNLPYTANESDIQGLFSKYGRLDEVHLVRNKAGDSSGMAYVHFAITQDAENALRELDGKPFQGRLLHILGAAEKKSHKLDDYEISKLPLKKQKALKRKIEAGGSTFSWNSMYMNPDAVLSSVADRLGVAKSDLIDPSSSDAAVKQAHAETHVIQETKTFFTSSGVNLDAFRQRERDDRTLLVKNFPFGTTVEELKTLFAPYGEIIRCLLPPSGTIAIIQYSQPGEGVQAMRNLAYRNFKGSVLYLDKGPKSLFNAGGQITSAEQPSVGAPPTTQQDDEPGKREQASSATLFVRNLNFATTTSGLIDAFKPLDGFLSARVKTKVDPRRPQEILSMGFGFVEFHSNHQARAAMAVMNGRRLDNHELLVQISHRAIDLAEEQRHKDNLKKAEAQNSKLIIKNLPFEATKKDVRALLSAYGQLRSVKVPKKFDHSTRGFAFADFVTPKEAANAMEALKDTHLLGRRLVLEYAEEESVDPEDEIRAIESKVGRQTEMIHLNKITGSTRNKFNIGSQDDIQ